MKITTQIARILQHRVFHTAPFAHPFPDDVSQRYVDMQAAGIPDSLSDDDLWERILHPAMSNLSGMVAHQRLGVGMMGARWRVGLRDGYISISMIVEPDQFKVAESFARMQTAA